MSTSLTGSRGATGSKIPKGYAAGKLQQYTPEQLGLFKSLFSQVAPGSRLSELAAGSEAGFAPFEQQALKDYQRFQGETASRFSQLAPGAMSAIRGSGFKNLQSQGAQDFALQLATQRQQLQRQALADLMGISEGLLSQRPYEQFLVKKQQQPSFFSRLFGAVAPAAGAAIGGAFGGVKGAQLGGQLGGSFASGFQPTQY